MDGAGTIQGAIVGPPPALSARTQSRVQGLAALALAMALGATAAADPWLLAAIVHAGAWIGFLIVGFWRAGLAVLALGTGEIGRNGFVGTPPPYAVVVALKDEAAIVPQLIERLSALDYPTDRLTGFLVVEASDVATIAAITAAERPSWLQLLVAPPDVPTTKPRALNIALSRVRSGLLTVYDAEDEPHPGQLREAVARFAAGPTSLACLQAPLRIRTRGRAATWLERQFALEYAALFEVLLPGLTRLGLPLPLGGTSNHFRVDVLREIGGWDPWNLTEDADLGFRLAAHGYTTGVLTLPTWEAPPPRLKVWLPQRTRWLKGYMQTWSVHMRRPWRLGWRGLASLHLTIGAAIASASLQGLVICWLAAIVLTALLEGVAPRTPIHDLILAGFGWATAGLCAAIGATRAGVPPRLSDLMTAPFYWALLSLAQVQAVWRLARQPFHWDKTPHAPDPPEAKAEGARLLEKPC